MFKATIGIYYFRFQNFFDHSLTIETKASRTEIH